MNGDFPVDDSKLFEHLKETSGFEFDEDIEIPPQESANDLPEGTRQILEIKNYAMINANWLLSSASGKTGREAVILLTGSSTPSSEVVKAYLRFVDADAQKPPSYIKELKRIDLYLDIRSLPMTLEQLKHKNRYIWVGKFSNGQIYGDMHSTP
jgi:hypothetical protein